MKKISLFAAIAAMFLFAGCDMLTEMLGKNPVATTGTVSGTVLYNNAPSSEGITVKLEKVEGDVTKSLASLSNARVAYSDGVVDVTTTDGSFSFENVPEGKYKVYASSYFSQTAAISDVITVRAAETTKVKDLALTALGTVKGKVTFDGKPQEDIEVYVAGVNYYAKTDALGNYKLTGIPAGTKVVVKAKYDDVTKSAAEVTVIANSEVTVETISLESVNKETTGTVKGKVLVGKDVEELVFVTISGTTFIAYTDADGNYTFSGVPAGEVKITSKRGEQVIYSETVTVESGKETVVPDLIFEEDNDEDDSHQVAVLKHVKRVKATENGILFEVSLPEVTGLSHTSGSQTGEVLGISGAGVTYSINTANMTNLMSYVFVFPFVEAGKDYDFSVSLYDDNSSYFYFTENIKVTAIGGLGELEISNADEVNFRITENSQDHVIVKLDEVPEVNVSKDFTYTANIQYTIVKNTSLEKIWAEDSVWLFAPNWTSDDPRVKEFDIFDQNTYIQDRTWFWRNVGTMKGYLRGEIVQVDGSVVLNMEGFGGTFTKNFGHLLEKNNGTKTVVTKHYCISPYMTEEAGITFNYETETVPYGSKIQAPIGNFKVVDYDLNKLEAFYRDQNSKSSSPRTGEELENYIKNTLKEAAFYLTNYEFAGCEYGYYAKSYDSDEERFVYQTLKYDSNQSLEFIRDYTNSMSALDKLIGEPVTDVYFYPKDVSLEMDFTFVVDGESETRKIDLVTVEYETLGYIPVKKGFGFTGWYIDEACTKRFEKENILDGLKVLYAGFIELKVVTSDFEYSFEERISEYFRGAWETTTITANSGVSCVKSPVTNHGSYSDMVLSVSLEESASLSFAYRTSSETNCDKLLLLINGNNYFVGSGEMNAFSNATYTIPAGTYDIIFRYSKDGSVSNYDDCVYIDDVSITVNSNN